MLTALSISSERIIVGLLDIVIARFPLYGKSTKPKKQQTSTLCERAEGQCVCVFVESQR